MSKTYIPLYRKYRPQTFHDLIGQENITQALTNAIELNKVAHAYLFCGPRGTGKTSSARIFAKSLNCIDGPTTKPCGKCPSCIDITNSTPVDVIEIDAASNRSVEDAQNILEKIQYVPIHGKYKIYIIDEVHMLSNQAFNALLKTLEEPPENVVFILATTEAHKVLETIVSRCQKFDFRRITVEDIVKRLEYISQEENINISKDALYAIAKSSQGGMRDSLALLDQLSILNTKKQIDVDDVENLLGKISVNILFELTEKITSNNPQEAILEINKIYSKGNEPLQILSNLIEYFRNLLIIKNCENKETILNLTQLNADVVEKLATQAQKIETSVINYVIDRLATYLRETKNATNRYLWLEVCIIELSNKLSTVGFSALVERIDALEKSLLGGVQITQKPQIQRTPLTTQRIEQKVEQPKVEPKQETEKSQPEVIDNIQEETIEEQQEQAQEQLQPEVQEEQKTSSSPISSGCDLWETLLSNFTSLPSKMFFSNLSCPMTISSEKIVIGFTKDVFVKQSREAGRMTPLKSAVETMFGTSNMPIEIRLISEDEANEIKSGVKKKSNLNKPNPSPIQITASQTSETQLNQPTSNENSDDGYYEQELAKSLEKKNPQPKQHSDQAKMILDLFNGKYMD